MERAPADPPAGETAEDGRSVDGDTTTNGEEPSNGDDPSEEETSTEDDHALLEAEDRRGVGYEVSELSQEANIGHKRRNTPRNQRHPHNGDNERDGGEEDGLRTTDEVVDSVLSLEEPSEWESVDGGEESSGSSTDANGSTRSIEEGEGGAAARADDGHGAARDCGATPSVPSDVTVKTARDTSHMGRRTGADRGMGVGANDGGMPMRDCGVTSPNPDDKATPTVDCHGEGSATQSS